MEQAGRDGHDAYLAALHVEDLRARVARRRRCRLLPAPRGLSLLRVTQRRTEHQDDGDRGNRGSLHMRLW